MLSKMMQFEGMSLLSLLTTSSRHLRTAIGRKGRVGGGATSWKLSLFPSLCFFLPISVSLSLSGVLKLRAEDRRIDLSVFLNETCSKCAIPLKDFDFLTRAIVLSLLLFLSSSRHTDATRTRTHERTRAHFYSDSNTNGKGIT